MHNVKRVRLGILEMRMAETREELEHFRDKESLIVIASLERQKDFFGEVVPEPNYRSSLPGMLLSMNGLRSLNSTKGRSAYEKAVYILSEINRQTQAAATIATFNLRFIQ